MCVTSRAHSESASVHCDGGRMVWEVGHTNPTLLTAFDSLVPSLRSLVHALVGTSDRVREEQADEFVLSPDCQSWLNLSHCSGPVRLTCLEHRHTHLLFVSVYICQFRDGRHFHVELPSPRTPEFCDLLGSTASLTNACTASGPSAAL